MGVPLTLYEETTQCQNEHYVAAGEACAQKDCMANHPNRGEDIGLGIMLSLALQRLPAE